MGKGWLQGITLYVRLLSLSEEDAWCCADRFLRDGVHVGGRHLHTYREGGGAAGLHGVAGFCCGYGGSSADRPVLCSCGRTLPKGGWGCVCDSGSFWPEVAELHGGAGGNDEWMVVASRMAG
jgi:hypothetical protein